MTFFKKHARVLISIVFVLALITAVYISPVSQETRVSAGMLQFCDVMWDGTPLPPEAYCCSSDQCGGGYSCNGVNGSNPGTCQPPAAVCTGSDPSNATACASDATPPVNTAKTVVSSCTPAGGGSPWCEFTCNAGYTLSGGTCVPIAVPSCTGSDPANATICIGDGSPLVDTAKTLVSACSKSNPPYCEFKCNSGYTYTPGGRSGPGSCVADAPAPDNNLCGFAWGATSQAPDFGVGWISFNRKDCDADGNGQSDGTPSGCPAAGTAIPAYGVSLDGSNNLTGYAWSSNIGWVQFGGLSGFPTGGGTTAANASLSGTPTSGTISGWAKVISGDEAEHGWDGWISLKGSTPYGVTVSSRQFDNFAWGDDVVGWLDFNADGSDGKNVRFCDAETLGVELSANPAAGSAPLNDVDLTAVVSGTATGNITYKFDCTNDGSYEATVTQSGAVYTAVDLCDYTTADTYTAKVEVSRGSVTQTDTTTINVTSVPVGGGDLRVSCSASGPAYVNQPLTWTATIDPDHAGVPPYTYSWDFDPEPSWQGPEAQTIQTTYPTIGTKYATVTAYDSGSPASMSDPCPANVNVKVKPSFIEI